MINIDNCVRLLFVDYIYILEVNLKNLVRVKLDCFMNDMRV